MYEDIVLFHFGGTHSFLEEISSNVDEDIQVKKLFLEIIEKHNQYTSSDVLKNMPNEFLIDDDILMKVRKHFNKKLSGYKDKNKTAKKSIIDYARTMQVKGGKSFFHKEGEKEYSKKSNMGHIQVSMEMPMGESKDPIGCRIRRAICINFKREK